MKQYEPCIQNNNNNNNNNNYYYNIKILKKKIKGRSDGTDGERGERERERERILFYFFYFFLRFFLISMEIGP